MKRFFVMLVVQLVIGLMLLAVEASAGVVASNIVSSDGREWEYVAEGIAVDALIYTDRDYVFTVVPDEFIGMPYMKTPCDSKMEGDALEITFDIDKPAYVYICWITPLPVREWVEENFELVMEAAVDVSWGAGNPCDVWKSKEPFENTVTLGYVGDGIGMYVGVVLEASAATAVQPEGKLSTTWGHLKRIQ